MFIGREGNHSVYLDNKLRFLNEKDYTDTSRMTYYDLFHKFVEYDEVAKNKDVSDYTEREIRGLIESAPTTSGRTKRSLFSCISAYIDWCCERGFNHVGNPCDSIDIKDIVGVNANAMDKSYIKMDDFKNKIDELSKYNSPQEIIIPIMARYGIKLDQMGNIKNENIDRESKLISVEDEKLGFVVLPIDEYFISWVDKAIACKDNTDANNSASKKDEIIEYIDNGFVIKQNNKSRNDGMVGKNTIYNKYNMVFNRAGITRINVASLNRSRKFDLILDLYDKNSELYHDDIERINQLFNGDKTVTPASTYLFKTDIVTLFDGNIDIKKRR